MSQSRFLLAVDVTTHAGSAQVAFGVMVCLVVLVGNLQLSPMFNNNVNRVQNGALMELSATLYLGLLLKVRCMCEFPKP